MATKSTEEATLKFATVPLDRLIVDKRYQRPLDKARVERMTSGFDPRLLGTLEVSERNGKVAVFDGQHRLAVLQALGHEDAPCLVHQALSPQEEANLFVELQRQRRPIRPVERFHAALFSGDPTAKKIKRIVEKAGWRIAKSSSGNRHDSDGIRAISTLESVFRQHGPDGLSQTLALANIWKGDPNATDALLLAGLATFIDAYGDRIDDDARERLAAVAPRTIVRRATGGGPGGGNLTARKFIYAELRKISGVRGRPTVSDSKK